MDRDTVLSSAESCFAWLRRSMSTPNDAQKGIFECYRVDELARNSFVRPDCNAEAARTLQLYAEVSGRQKYTLMQRNLVEWLLSIQVHNDAPYDGTFPFYLIDGLFHDDKKSHYLYQNDHGKVLVVLIDLYRAKRDIRLLRAAQNLAQFFIGIQKTEGFFYDKTLNRLQPEHQGPCFVLWIALGLLLYASETGNNICLKASQKAFGYCQDLLLPSGRIKTTYEIERGEAWRPASSETAIAMYCFARAWKEVRNPDYLHAAQACTGYILTLQSENGGIANCDAASLDASEQNSYDLTDFVYTQGYALMGLTEMAAVIPSVLPSTKQLALFLLRTQCKGESPEWDGAWRGSYNIVTKQWSGRANQNNVLEEGGMYTIYTGWCCMPIVQGLLTMLILAED